MRPGPATDSPGRSRGRGPPLEFALRQLAPAAVALSGLLLSGCAVLPSASPTAVELAATPTGSVDPDLVTLDLDLPTAKAIAAYRRPGLSSLGADLYKPTLVLKPGDVIATTVYEVSPIPLFGAAGALQPATPATKDAPASGHAATLPAQVIEQDGTVPVPFGGTIRVAGLTPAGAGAAIARSLEGKTTHPQAVVSLVTSTVNTASVNGDVGRPGLVPITVKGERVLDAIAQAGGPRDPTFDTDVELVRRGRIARANMQRLVEDARENLRVEPGDSIVVVRNPRSFTVLGAATKSAQYNFDVERVSLAEAVARAGGLNDTVADVGEIYLMRFEPPELVRTLLPPRDPRLARLDGSRPPVPVAYHLSLRGAGGYFVSQAVQMRDKDVVLVANAQAVELSKAVQILRGIAGIYYDFRTPAASTSRGTGSTVVTGEGGGDPGD